LKTDEQCWTDSGLRLHGAGLAKDENGLASPWPRGEQQGSQGNMPGKINGGVAHREAPVPVGRRRSSGAATFLSTTALQSAGGR
jgi:hypothetical protein